MIGLLDGYFNQTGHHLNVNVFNRSLLEDAMEHPENILKLTIGFWFMQLNSLS